MQTNSIVHLSQAIAKVAAWQAPIRLGETTIAYFETLASFSPPADAERYRAVLKPETKEGAAAFEYMLANEPRHASMLHTSISPNMVTGGYRVNVIPSEAKATLDVRLVPGENPEQLLESVRKVVDDPTVEVGW